MGINIKTTNLPSVLIISPKRFKDHRGFFEESWNEDNYLNNGIMIKFVQDNHSFSVDKGTIRGLHFQHPPYAQDKLVRCTRGAIFDVAVDIQKGSPTYGHWFGTELSRDNGNQLLIPKGYLHGFLTLVSNTEVQYKCSNYYKPDHDGSVLWNSLGINWPIEGDIEAILSEKDSNAQSFEEFDSPFIWENRS